MRRLLLVDGGNILIRCAFGGSIEPQRSTPVAVGMIERAIKDVEASHVIIAADCSRADSWRRAEYPEYKADRTRDTGPWMLAGAAAFRERGWIVKGAATFEADDVIATLAVRAVDRMVVVVLSNDSDLLPLCTLPNCLVVRPGKDHELVTEADVFQKFGVKPGQLADYKALVGEPGDHVPGVPGIGAKRAAKMLSRWPNLDAIIQVGKDFGNPDATIVARYEDEARRALRLVKLRLDVPLPPINPSECAVK